MQFSSFEQDEPAKAPRSLRILVADDDRDTVLTLTTVLRHEGYDTRGVYRGQDVLSTFEDYEPDAVLLDINMPDMNGYDVARAIKNIPYGPRPLLIGISGVYRKGADKVLAGIVGFDHYLTKPYEASEVLKLLAPLRNASTGRLVLTSFF
jgi:CheY-like chemotaxis protein